MTSLAFTPIVLHVPPPARLDEELFFALCQANRDYRFERAANGDIYIMPPTGGETGWKNAEILTDLTLWARKNGQGVVFDSSTGFNLPNGATRSPDVAWVLRERLARLRPEQKQKFLPLAPDFVIELASPSDALFELQQKMADYLANGARLGWLMVPAQRQVYVYEQGKESCCLDAPQRISGEPVLPGFVLELVQIWQVGF